MRPYNRQTLFNSNEARRVLLTSSQDFIAFGVKSEFRRKIVSRRREKSLEQEF